MVAPLDINLRGRCMKKILVNTIDLDNGLELKLYDRSRKIAADRWQAVCIAAVEVPVDFPGAAQLVSDAGVDRDDLTGIFGTAVVFEKVQERNFVHENDLKQVVHAMLASMAENMGPYLSRPTFPGRFLLRKIQEHRRQNTLREQAK